MTGVERQSRLAWITASVIALVLLTAAALLALHGSRNVTIVPGLADLFIGISFIFIAVTLAYVAITAARGRWFPSIVTTAAAVLLSCAATHLMQAWTLGGPPFEAAGWLKIVTAAASVSTALLLPPMVPKLLRLLREAQEASSRQQELEKAYAELSDLYRKATQPAPRKERISSIIDLRSSKRPEGLADIAREVTEHARQLERARYAAEDANQAKDQFLAVLSHELRTPLTPALAAASDLEANPGIRGEELRESLSLIRRNIELEARLVDDLLDLTRISKGKLQVQLTTVDLHDTIQHAAEMCRSEAKTPCSNLILHLDAATHHVRGDAARLAQVIWNLALNAVKFTPPEGSVTIRSSNPQPNRVRIEVSDTGIGIEPDKLTRIFEPFHQGEASMTRRYGGLGLGLSVAKGLMDAHGGTITAQSEGINRGTTFTIEMSTTTAAAEEKLPAAVLPNESATPLRILVVEDHSDTRQALCRILTRWGHQVTSVGTVADAMEAAAKFQPELLLSDIGLPDGTGVQLLERMRNDSSFVAIAMSGYGMEADLEQTKRAGFKAHLVKPVSADRLKETIANLATESLSGT